MALRFGSLFAGIGGFDLGFERAGMKCVWQVEIDGQCTQVLAEHWPNAERFGDIHYVGKHNLYAVDVICGGFPCQDVSVAGPRTGLAGERSGLWFEFRRVVSELMPRWVIVENVPGLLSSNEGQDFATILQGLVKLRYRVCWRILDAQYFGVPQRRRRVFIVGSLGDGSSAEVLFERESCAGDPPPGGITGEDVAFTLAASVRGTGDGHGQGWNSNYVTAAPIKAGSPSRRNGGSSPTGDEFIVAYSLTAAPGARMSAEDNYLVFDETQITSPDNYSNPQPGDPCPALAHGARPPTIAWNWQSGGDARGLAFSDKPTLISNQVPAIGVRRLTPVECERLQGFPDGWTGGQSDSARYRMLGNAVCVPVAEWIGRRIAALEGHW